MKKLENQIENWVLKACEELNCRLYLMEWNSEGLKVYVDRTDQNISLLECEKISKRIYFFLKAKGLDGKWSLEVSSPGLERKLKYPWHFKSAVGKKICVITVTAVEGQKKFVGCLTQSGETGIVLESPDRMLKIPIQNIQKAHLICDIQQEKKPDLMI